MISIIVAMGRNREIGKNNGMLWNIKEEMNLFRNITLHTTVIMGRKTYDSIGFPLKNRKNIVLTNNKDLQLENVEVINNIDEIIKRYKDIEEEVFVIGGEKIYSEFLPYASRLYISNIKNEYNDATSFFPKFDKEKYIKVYEYEYEKFIFTIYDKKGEFND